MQLPNYTVMELVRILTIVPQYKGALIGTGQLLSTVAEEVDELLGFLRASKHEHKLLRLFSREMLLSRDCGHDPLPQAP